MLPIPPFTGTRNNYWQALVVSIQPIFQKIWFGQNWIIFSGLKIPKIIETLKPPNLDNPQTNDHPSMVTFSIPFVEKGHG